MRDHEIRAIHKWCSILFDEMLDDVALTGLGSRGYGHMTEKKLGI